MSWSKEPHGTDRLRNPALNCDSAFSQTQRQKWGLEGLLPPSVESLDNQVSRALAQLNILKDDLQQYQFLMDLHARNRTLFFALLMSDPARFMPLVYTPTVGAACENFHRLYRQPEGLYLPITAKGRLRELMSNWPQDDVRFIVVTDGERILGLGDLGANGMGIPIGKLALYTAVAGVPPELTLPILLDVGTNNDELLNDPLYLGLRQPRVRGAVYNEFIAEFVEAVQELFPKCCLQWEDFANFNAEAILGRYRDKICTYNDDIQGTAGVALAGIYGCLKISQQKLNEQRFLFMGAGAAATGIAELICEAMMMEGLSREEAYRRCWLFDIHGLVESSRTDLAGFQKPFAHQQTSLNSFVEAIETLKPTGIIGVSTVPKLFNQPVIEAMSRVNQRPIIFPYSNPTSHSECTAEEAYTWSRGAAIFASGSPFPPFTLNDRTFVPGQGNNVYIFPAMGMAVLATEAKRVTQQMFIVAARAVAEQVTPQNLEVGLIYPPQANILEASLHTATRIAEYIFDNDLAGVPKPQNIEAHVRAMAYRPEYDGAHGQGLSQAPTANEANGSQQRRTA